MRREPYVPLVGRRNSIGSEFFCDRERNRRTTNIIRVRAPVKGLQPASRLNNRHGNGNGHQRRCEHAAEWRLAERVPLSPLLVSLAFGYRFCASLSSAHRPLHSHSSPVHRFSRHFAFIAPHFHAFIAPHFHAFVSHLLAYAPTYGAFFLLPNLIKLRIFNVVSKWNPNFFVNFSPLVIRHGLEYNDIKDIKDR